MIHLSQTNAKGFDELVFQDRNQAYGAYVLRREYPKNVLKSLLIGVALIASILAIPYLTTYFKDEVVTNTDIPDRNIVITNPPPTDPIPDPVEPKGGPKPEGNLKKFTTLLIVAETLDDTMLTNKDFKDFDPSNVNNVGDGPGNFVQGPGNDDDDVIGKDDGNKVYPPINIEQVPEFPGGEKAMYKFLDDNMVYPEHARNIGLEGKVYVTFVVDQFGNLTNIATPRPLGGGLDDEAVRVIKLMPRWKPGKMNGKPVKVKYNLPIVFKLN